MDQDLAACEVFRAFGDDARKLELNATDALIEPDVALPDNIGTAEVIDNSAILRELENVLSSDGGPIAEVRDLNVTSSSAARSHEQNSAGASVDAKFESLSVIAQRAVDLEARKIHIDVRDGAAIASARFGRSRSRLGSLDPNKCHNRAGFENIFS